MTVAWSIMKTSEWQCEFAERNKETELNLFYVFIALAKKAANPETLMTHVSVTNSSSSQMLNMVTIPPSVPGLGTE